MEDIYHKYYLSGENIIELLRSALIVFDTSALLDLYNYSDTAQNNILTTVFDYLDGRIWMPAQIQFEFLKNHEKVANKPAQAYRALVKKSKSGDSGHVVRIQELVKNFASADLKQIRGQYQTLFEKTSSDDKHPFIPKEIYSSFERALADIELHIQEFQTAVDAFSQQYEIEVDKQVTKLENRTDTIQSCISEKFRIGPELSYNDMIEIAKEGSYRYQEKIPPGYKDADKKTGLQKYGDLFIWKDILKFAVQTQQDVLLITNDIKDDWLDKETSAPRFELLKEFFSITNHRFWSCTMKEFLYLFNQVLDNQQRIPEEVLQEVDVVQELRSAGQIGDSEDQYREFLQNWMFTSSDLHITGTLPIRPEWKFGRTVRLYEGFDSSGKLCVILLNLLPNNFEYKDMLQAMKNPFIVKETYEAEGLVYEYHQFTLTNSLAETRRVLAHANRPPFREWFRNITVQSNIGYIEKDHVFVIDGNHPMG